MIPCANVMKGKNNLLKTSSIFTMRHECLIYRNSRPSRPLNPYCMRTHNRRSNKNCFLINYLQSAVLQCYVLCTAEMQWWCGVIIAWRFFCCCSGPLLTWFAWSPLLNTKAAPILRNMCVSRGSTGHRRGSGLAQLWLSSWSFPSQEWAPYQNLSQTLIKKKKGIWLVFSF